jgi:hypothetical protein
MRDLEAFVQGFGDVLKKCVICIPIGHDQVCRHGRLFCIQRPNSGATGL